MPAKYLAAFALLALPLVSVSAQAKPELQMNMTAEKEVTVTENGKKAVKRVPAQSSAPGEVLIYTLNYKNVGDEKATAVNVDNPLPNGTRYLANSASGNDAQINFSIDGGKTYAKPDQLAVQKAGKKAKAEAPDYTNIRWVLGEVKPGQSGQLGFRAQVE
ncbi:MAG: hypothetical protein REI12_14150 [Pedobacter sp.]|nr:hypothetical protein [Pedobacter sp.]